MKKNTQAEEEMTTEELLIEIKKELVTTRKNVQSIEAMMLFAFIVAVISFFLGLGTLGRL